MSDEVAELVATVREMVAAGRTGYKLDVLMAKRQPALVPPKVVLDLLDTLEVCADRLSGIGADLARVQSELSVEKAQVVFWERLAQRRSDEWKAAESALAISKAERPGVHWCSCPAPKPAIVAYESIDGRPRLCSKCKGVPGELFGTPAGTFAEGIEAAAKVCACRPSSIRALKPNPFLKEEQKP